MSRRNLQYLLAPRSLAVIGASDRPRSIGATVMRNLRHGQFRGPVWAVNPRHDTVDGAKSYASVAQLPETPELAVICTPAPSVPGIIAELGARGTRAALVLSAGLERAGADGASGTLADAMLLAARPFCLRILGPNCIGLLVPAIGLNASFAHVGARTGSLAFVAQSGALTTAMLEWAQARGIGFSHFVSLGNAAYVDFGDLLEYLGTRAETRAILLYVESITAARKFMSAARAAARAKPVIVVKAGRTAAAARAATSHSGALAGSDAVYEAALRRAGVLRVATTRQLFEAAEILAHPKAYLGPRLAIISNGGGPAVMATDALIEGGGELAELAAATLARLDELLPRGWSHANPVDIIGDAPPERYVAVVERVLEDASVDALLVIHAPTAVASAAEVARACTPLLAGTARPALGCWLGGEARGAGDDAQTGVPAYATAEEAVEAFLHLTRYHQAQAQLQQTPTSVAREFRPDAARARAVVAAALLQGRRTLTEPEAKDVLAAYQIPVVETRIARDAEEAGRLAAQIGFPVALKVLSPDITHKSDVGGVVLDIESPPALQQAAAAILERCHARLPQARIEGFTVQRMARRGGAQELLAGIAVDATFGPTIVFGQGGTAVELIADRALALPPLDSVLARDLMTRTRVYRLLKGYRDHLPADLPAIELTLMKLAQLAIDVAELTGLDINPLLAGPEGVLALDARITVAPASQPGIERLAIRPYPAELEEQVDFQGRALLLRPIRPEDLPQHRQLIAATTAEDRRARFFSLVKELPEPDLARLTQIDYEREMAFIATAADASGQPQTLGVVRASTDPENLEAEFAILVRSDLHRQGLGTLMMRKLIRYCRERGTRRLAGEVLSDNSPMLALAQAFGFARERGPPGLVHLRLELQGPRDERGARKTAATHPYPHG